MAAGSSSTRAETLGEGRSILGSMKPPVDHAVVALDIEPGHASGEWIILFRHEIYARWVSISVLYGKQPGVGRE